MLVICESSTLNKDKKNYFSIFGINFIVFCRLLYILFFKNSMEFQCCQSHYCFSAVVRNGSIIFSVWDENSVARWKSVITTADLGSLTDGHFFDVNYFFGALEDASKERDNCSLQFSTNNDTDGKVLFVVTYHESETNRRAKVEFSMTLFEDVLRLEELSVHVNKLLDAKTEKIKSLEDIVEKIPVSLDDYLLTMSSVIFDTSVRELITMDACKAVGTKNDPCPFIAATFRSSVTISGVILAAPISHPNWGPDDINGCVFMYSDDGEHWMRLFTVEKMTKDLIKVFRVNCVTAKYFRLCSATKRYIGTGVLKFC